MSNSKQDSIEQATPHSVRARVIHWGFIGVIAFALAKQLDEVEELEDFSLLQYEMAFATIFLILLFARFFYMRATRPTALPSNTPIQTRRLARAGHLAIYICLSLIALTGLMIGGLYWSGIKSGTAMDIVLLLHEIAVNTSYFLILGHILAAIYHRRRSDGIWDAMVPFWRESKGD